MNKTKLLRLKYTLSVIVLISLSCQSQPGDSGSKPGIQAQSSAVTKQLLPTITTQLEAGSHPRLFFKADEIPTLQAQASSSHQEIWEPIKNYVDSQLGTTPKTTFSSRGDLETYRNFGNQLIAFAFACVITQEAAYCDLAKTYLLTFASWDQWGDSNERNLGHAHMLLGNALAYDWLYNYLTPEERQTVRQSLASWTQKMYEASVEPKTIPEWNNWWRDAYAQNHYTIIHSAMGMASLALLGEDEQALNWLNYTAERLYREQSLLNGIEDGSWHESLGYQNYALTFALPFWVNLRNITGVNLFPQLYLQNYPYWRIYNHLPGTTQFIMAFGDFGWWWGNNYKAQNILRLIAHEYGSGQAEWMAQQLIAADGRQADIQAAPWYVFEFLYYDPAIPAQAPTDLEKTRVFPDLEGVIWRTGWEENDLVFGLKTGSYGGRYAFEAFTQQTYPWEPPCRSWSCPLNHGHDHDDTNTFYLYKAGAWLAPETAEVHHSDTAFHNTLLIDGQGQYRPQQSRDPAEFVGSDGFLAATASTPNFDYVAANATQRYRHIKGLRDFTRHVIFIRPTYLVMLDNLVADSAHQYEWVSHAGQQVAVEENWVQASAGGGQILGIGTVAPQPFKITSGEDGLPYIRIQPAEAIANVRFINVLYPTDHSSWQSRPNLSLLEDNGTAAAVRVQQNNGSSQVEEILFTYGEVGSRTTVAQYNYDGQTAVIGRNGEGQLERLFMFGGTFLQDTAQNQMLVANLAGDRPFEAIYSGQNLAISGDLPPEITLYAPQVATLRVNGQHWTFTQSNDYITVNNTQ